jgi:hypothetical protein
MDSSERVEKRLDSHAPGSFIQRKLAGALHRHRCLSLGSLVLFPVTLLTVATVFAFGPIAGYGYALLGCLLSAAFTFFLGRILGSDFMRRLAGSRFDRIRRKVGRGCGRRAPR